MRRRLFRAEQPRDCPGAARAARRARRQHRRRRDDAAPLQRAPRERTGISHDRKDRHLMAVLVTGGCGHVGSRLTEALPERTHGAVDVLDACWFGNHWPSNPRLTVTQADVRQIDDLDLSGYDTIFHLAGIANDPAAELNPYGSWEVNVLATMRLVDRAARQGVRQFVF